MVTPSTQLDAGTTVDRLSTNPPTDMQTFDSPEAQGQAGEKSADAHAERPTEEVYSSLDGDGGVKLLVKSIREMSERLYKSEAQEKKRRADSAEMMRKSAEMNTELGDTETHSKGLARSNRITDDRLEREAVSVSLSESSSSMADLRQSFDSIDSRIQDLIGWVVYKDPEAFARMKAQALRDASIAVVNPHTTSM